MKKGTKQMAKSLAAVYTKKHTIFLKTKKGITLVALVVTIIVMVILAGATIEVISGSDGLIARAVGSISSHEIISAKECVAIRIGEYNAEYYDKVYLTMEEVAEENPGDYIYNKYGGASKKIETGGYKFIIIIPEGQIKADEAHPYDVMIEANKKLKTQITGKLTLDGELKWDEENRELATPGGTEPPEEEPPEKYTITYEANGATSGSVPTDDTEYEEGATVEVKFPTNLVKTGYIFKGWATSAGGNAVYVTGTNYIYDLDESKTLYAVWNEIYTVIYNANGATSGSVPTDNTEYEKGITAKVKAQTDLKRIGYKFKGWKVEGNTENTIYNAGDNYAVNATTTFIAEWELLADGTWDSDRGVNSPKLMEGMAAVYWENDTEIKQTDSNFDGSKWYNYSSASPTSTADYRESKWANAMTEDGSFWVWIPRYEYQITDKPSSSANAGKINVNFIKTEQNEAKSGYTIHPAFRDDSNSGADKEPNTNDDYANGGWNYELSGIWVAKFEMSQETKTDGSNWVESNKSYGGRRQCQQLKKLKNNKAMMIKIQKFSLSSSTLFFYLKKTRKIPSKTLYLILWKPLM